MSESVLSKEDELGIMVEIVVYKHMVSLYQGRTVQLEYFRKSKGNLVLELPRQEILCEVNYFNNSNISTTYAIVELCQDENSKVTNAF